jgi:predicted HicB family RNase H-like nuclease
MPKQIFSKKDPPVRFDVRLPKSLHHDLTQEAFRRKKSLNEIILEKLLKP